MHLCTAQKYDSPFVLASDFIFERAFPGRNIFFLISYGKSDYQYTDSKFITKYTEEEAGAILPDMLKQYDVVILHGLNGFYSKLVLGSEDPRKFLWIFWGAEVYNNPLLNKENILGEKTQKLASNRNEISIRRIKQLVRKYLIPLPQFKLIKAAASLIIYVAATYEEDYLNLKSKQVAHPDSQFLFFTYFPPEFVFKDISESTVKGENILLGNSATPENNHVEALNILKSFTSKTRKIITVLSYGDEIYGKKILKKGRELFPEEFEPVMVFMPMDKYMEILKSCSVAIMNHYRQQGIGNIYSLLLMGTKVFLNERNTMFHYLKRIGCYVYSVTEINSSNMDAMLRPLTQHEADHNKKILKMELAADRLVQHLQSYFEKNFLVN